ncbi:MAG: DUF3108 domain-containing protein [Nevskiales bacterium]
MSTKPLLFFIASALLLSSFGAHADVLSPYKAVYELSRGKMMLGDTTFTLSLDGDACYRLRGVAEPMGLAALLAGKTTEESRFCESNGRLRSQSYRREQENGDKDDSYSLRFDWGNRMVTTNGGDPRELPADGLDRGLMEVMLRQLLMQTNGKLPKAPYVFLLVEDDEVTPYSLQVTGREDVSTPVGRFDTVRVERVNPGKREMRLWLAPELDYLPVKLERQKKGDPAISMILRELPLSPNNE